MSPENVYAVLLRSEERLSVAGAHTFAEPLREGAEVKLLGKTWMVEEVRAEETPPSAILRRYFVKPS